MRKALALSFLLFLTLGLFAGYLFLNEKIITGSIKIIEGQKQLEQGEQMLAKGKVKLANGKQKLAQAKKVYQGVRSIPFAGVATHLPVSGRLLKDAGNKIAAGDQLIAKGHEKVLAGEKQLAEGRLQLHGGIEQLNWAKRLRTVCGIGTIFFAALFIILVLLWRQLFRTFYK